MTILLTGLPRSGTSMVSGILSACGVDFGDTCGATAYNKKGQFEHTQIREKYIKQPLLRHGFDRLGQDPLPDPGYQFQGESVGDLGVEAFKDPKLLITWPYWERSLSPAWILVIRNWCDTVSSMEKVHWFKNTSVPILALAYTNHQSVLAKQVRNLHTIFVDDIIDGNTNQIQQVVEELGYVWNDTVVNKWIDKSLWNGGK